jgi:hypothetical protein
MREVKDLYNENLKTLMKEIEEDIKIREDNPCSWNGRQLVISKSH